VKPEEMAVASQRLSKDIPAATNMHTTAEEFLEAVFSMRPLLYQIINM
jgi:hypothetical protein